MSKKVFVIHPFLLAVYPVVFLFSYNISQISFSAIFKPIAVILGFSLASWFILNIFLKDRQKSGVIVSLFLILFFSYGHFRTLGGGNWQIFWLPFLWISLFVLGFHATVRSRKSFHKVTMILNMVSAVLVAFSAANIIIYQFPKVSLPEQYTGIQGDSGQRQQTETYPDIYFIVLDAYGRQDILQEIYDFDNSEFIDFLRDKGFYIAERATSNYCQTYLSIGSCFNLMYLDEWVKQIARHDKGYEPARKLCDKGYIQEFLRKQGYTIVSFSPKPVEPKLQNTDVHLHHGVLINEFQNALRNTTPLPDIMVIKENDSLLDTYRNEILYMLNTPKEIQQLDRTPKFVYMHVKIPHPPFVFGPNGEPIKAEAIFNSHDGDRLIQRGRLSKAQYRKHYRNQVIFINSQIKKMVNKILANSSQPPIIMLISDHGPRSEVVWKDPEKTNVRECMSILSAYYLPNDGSKHLYPEISLVNIFRVILNQYFGQNLELLPDKNYSILPSYQDNFYNVTEKVQKEPF